MKRSKFNRPLSIAFEKNQFEKIKNYSDEDEVSMAEWIRESLKAYVSGEIFNFDKYSKND